MRYLNVPKCVSIANTLLHLKPQVKYKKKKRGLNIGLNDCLDPIRFSVFFFSHSKKAFVDTGEFETLINILYA